MRFKKGQSGNPKGRPKGSKNKMTNELREIVVQASSIAGDVIDPTKQHGGGALSYLVDCALHEDKTIRAAFVGALRSCIPKDVKIDADSELVIAIERSFVKGKGEK